MYMKGGNRKDNECSSGYILLYIYYMTCIQSDIDDSLLEMTVLELGLGFFTEWSVSCTPPGERAVNSHVHVLPILDVLPPPRLSVYIIGLKFVQARCLTL